MRKQAKEGKPHTSKEEHNSENVKRIQLAQDSVQ
jgi:hypothetical protein